MADFVPSNNTFEYDSGVYNPKSATIILPLVFDYLNPKSVLDVGCGLGTWLSVVEKLGVNDFQGVEGHYISQNELFIPKEKLIIHDLSTPLNLERKFDLVVSLEVAEHLPESSAKIFVTSLVQHGKVILFSAAIPRQGGQKHLNEQWPKYWMELFSEYGFLFYDVLRPQLWEDDRIEYWYRQNIFLVMHESVQTSWGPFDGKMVIHPCQWIETLRWVDYDLKELLKEKDQLEKQSFWLSAQLENWKRGLHPIKSYLQGLKKAITRKLSH
jgi:SAM-dependent methyltransferase